MRPAAADRLLDRLERCVPVRPPWAEIATPGAERAIVFGDTHGDWRSTLEVAGMFLREPHRTLLVGLGDYIDRAPADCAEGSVANLLYLLGLAATFPQQVWLLQGNHETVRRISVLPHDTPEEVDQLWGPERLRYERMLALAERGPFIARTTSGALLAHAGFPRGADWRRALAEGEEAAVMDCVWAECAASRLRRGAASAFTEAELRGFLRETGTRFLLRGHDPDLVGERVFHDLVLTLHTSRLYQARGGVIAAEVPLGDRIVGLPEVRVRHLPSEGREYPEPATRP